jgi:hypothetical protein
MSKENRSNKRNEDNRNRGMQGDNSGNRQSANAPRTTETGAQNSGGQTDRNANVSSNRSKEDKNARR